MGQRDIEQENREQENREQENKERENREQENKEQENTEQENKERESKEKGNTVQEDRKRQSNGRCMLTEQAIVARVSALEERLIGDVRRLVQIDSVETPAQPGAPFGPGVKRALKEALKIGQEMGFSTTDLDGHIGYVEYGQGEDYVCAIGHVDVVPPGDGWRQPPFSGYLAEGTLYGRGVLDNKGPILACLYGLYALKELGYVPSHRIRIIFGCDEETGFEDLRYYLEKEQPPVYGFTPDCKFPVVYAERGRATVRIYGADMERFYAFVTQYFIGAKNTGDRLGIDFSHPEYGVMEMRNYKLGIHEGTSYFEAALSYPAGHKIQEILERIREKAAGMEVTLVQNYDPVVFDKESPMVQALTRCYEAVTGEDGTPVTTTGGTYAKAMQNIVPFGPSFPGQKGIGHNPNEWMRVDDLMENAKIYALALYHLGRL